MSLIQKTEFNCAVYTNYGIGPGVQGTCMTCAYDMAGGLGFPPVQCWECSCSGKPHSDTESPLVYLSQVRTTPYSYLTSTSPEPF